MSSAPQTFSISLGGTTYQLTFHYHNVDMGGWVLDIADASNKPILCGIPLVLGVDLLAQYAYLNFGGMLVVMNDGGGTAVPTFQNIGKDSHIYFVTS